MPGFLPPEHCSVNNDEYTLSIPIPRRKNRPHLTQRRSRFHTHKRAASSSSSSSSSDGTEHRASHHRGRTSSPRRSSVSRSRSRARVDNSSSDSSSSNDEILTYSSRIFRNFKVRRDSTSSSSSSSSSEDSSDHDKQRRINSKHLMSDYTDHADQTDSSSSSSSSNSSKNGVLTFNSKLFYGLRGKNRRYSVSSSSGSSSRSSRSHSGDNGDISDVSKYHEKPLERVSSSQHKSLLTQEKYTYKYDSDSDSVSSISSHSSRSSMDLEHAIYGYKSEHTYNAPEEMWRGLSENAMHAQWAIDDRRDGMRTLVVATKEEESWKHTCNKLQQPFELIRAILHLALACMFIAIVILETAEESQYYRTMTDSQYTRVGNDNRLKEHYIVQPDEILDYATRYISLAEGLEDSVERHLDIPNSVVALVQTTKTDGNIVTYITRSDMGPLTVGLDSPAKLLPWLQDENLQRFSFSLDIKQFAFNPARRCDEWHVETVVKTEETRAGVKAKNSVKHSLCMDPKVSERVHAADVVALVATGVSLLLFLVYAATLTSGMGHFCRYVHASTMARCKKPDMHTIKKTKVTVNKFDFVRDVHWTRTKISCGRHFSVWHVVVLCIFLQSCAYSTFQFFEYTQEYNVVDVKVYSTCLALVTFQSILSLLPTIGLFPYSYRLQHVTVSSAWKMQCRVLVGIIPVFVGYSLLGWVVLNGQNGQFNNLDLITMHLFAIMNGDGILDFFNLLFGAAPSITMKIFTRVYVYTYCLFFTQILARLVVAVVGFYVNFHDPKHQKKEENKQADSRGEELDDDQDFMNDMYDINAALESMTMETPTMLSTDMIRESSELRFKSTTPVRTPLILANVLSSRNASPHRTPQTTPHHFPSSRTLPPNTNYSVPLPALHLDEADTEDPRRVQFLVDTPTMAVPAVPVKRFIWQWPELHTTTKDCPMSVLLKLPVFTGSLLPIMNKEDQFIRNQLVSLEPKIKDPTFLLRHIDSQYQLASPLPNFTQLEPYLVHFCTCLFLHSVGYQRRILKLEKQFYNQHKRSLLAGLDANNEYTQKVEIVYQNSIKAFWGRVEKKIFNRFQPSTTGIQK